MANDEVDNYSMEPSGGSRLLGVNQLQSSLDRLTGAITSLGTKMGGGGGWSGSGATFNNTGSFQTANGGGTNGGGPSFGGGPTLGAASSGGNGGWGGGALMAGMGGIAAFGGVLGMAKGLASSGGPLLASGSNMSVYQQISNYRMQAGLGLANNRAAMTNLMNLAGYGNHTLNIAANAGDAGAGMASLLYNSGSYGGLNARGTNMYTMSGGIGITTPGMSFSDNASLAAQIYSPQFSQMLRMSGFQTTPLSYRGGQTSPAQLYSSMFQRWFGSNRVSSSRLASNFGSNGEITAQLAQFGITGSNAVAFQNSLTAYNQLANKGYSAGQINHIFSGAATHNRSALAALQRAGVDVNNITQLQKNAAAINTQRAGGQEAAFQSGLAESTGLINEFNSALNGLLNGPLRGFMHGVNWARGFGAGARGMPSGSGGAASSTAGSMGGGVSAATSMVSGAAMSAVGFAKQEIGVPYVWGGSNPSMGGFDCSGLVQWAYKQAGVNLPRTSQAQWASLMGKHSIPLNQVQAGDLVFMAGSDGTPNAPGHVAMAVSSNQLIQAEQTGTRIQVTPYNPSAWSHAARPTGSGVSGSGNAGTGTPGGGTANSMGLAIGMGGGYTDSTLSSMGEASALSSALMGGGMLSGMLGNTGYAGTGSSATGKTKNNGNSPNSAPPSPANPKGNVALGQKLAASRGWTGSQWDDLYALWTRESGWSNTARNPQSGAYGIAQALGHGPSNQYPGGQYMGANQPPYGTSNATEQILWGLSYIAGRYGNPANAWSHENSAGWYARGTQNLPPGVSILGEQGPEAVVNRGSGQQVLTAGQTAGLLAGIQSGQMRGGGGGPGVCVNVNVAQGAVVLNGLTGGGSAPGTPGLGSTDVQGIGQAIADAVEKAMEKSTLMQQLAAGVS